MITRTERRTDETAQTRGPTMAPHIQEAWFRSFLNVASREDREVLINNSWEAAVAPGEEIQRELARPGPPHLMLVLRGVVRVYRTSAAGRRVTLRLARAGGVIGLPSVVVNTSPAGVQAVSKGRVLHLSVASFQSVTKRDPALAWAMSVEISRSLFTVQERLVHNAFASVGARVALHLLDVADPVGGRLIVSETQQEIADAIGSVREVVGRQLTLFRDRGFVNRAGGGLVLLDPLRLNDLVSDEAAGVWRDPSYAELVFGVDNQNLGRG